MSSSKIDGSTVLTVSRCAGKGLFIGYGAARKAESAETLQVYRTLPESTMVLNHTDTNYRLKRESRY